MLERMQPIAEAIIEPEIVFSFPSGSVPAPPLVTMDRVQAGYDGRIVLDRLSLRIDPDDRIALLGTVTCVGAVPHLRGRERKGAMNSIAFAIVRDDAQRRLTAP